MIIANFIHMQLEEQTIYDKVAFVWREKFTI